MYTLSIYIYIDIYTYLRYIHTYIYIYIYMHPYYNIDPDLQHKELKASPPAQKPLLWQCRKSRGQRAESSESFEPYLQTILGCCSGT